MEKVGVSQKAVIFNKEGKLLTIHRTSTAPTRPNKWDLPGGDLDFGEEAAAGMLREIKEETGLQVKKVKAFDVESHTTNIGDFWVTIAYKAQTDSNNVILSFEHDDYKWVTAEEFLNLESSPKLKRFVKNLKNV